MQSLVRFFDTCSKRITRHNVSGILNAGNSSVTLDRILHERLNLRVLFLKSLNYFSLVAKLTSLTLSIAILIFASSRSSVAFMFF